MAEKTMTERVIELVRQHDRNPVMTIAALLNVAAMMATRIGVSPEDWQVSVSSAWDQTQARWADFDRKERPRG